MTAYLMTLRRALASPRPTAARITRPITLTAWQLGSARRGYAAEAAAGLKRTPLYDFHRSNAAKMVPFGGYEMPLSYEGSGGQLKEHEAVRKACGMFDVSHMVQHVFSGPASTEFLATLVPSDIQAMKEGSAGLSVLLNEQGGIIDDCMVTSWGENDGWYLVTNAGRRDEDLAWIEDRLSKFRRKDEVKWDVLEGWGLVALQGPNASKVLQPLLGPQDVQLDKSLFFGQTAFANLDGAKVHIARGGYTGEDGFEISVPPEHAARVAKLLADQAGVTLCGLAARDSLRLEAGLCLYGHDLDESVGTGEAALGWVVGKSRTGFVGEQRTRDEKGDKIRRRRVGLVVEKGPVAREGAVVTDEGGEEVGKVTSGIPSPTLGQNIAMAYVKTGSHKKGTKLKVIVRGKPKAAEVVKMPFVDAKYFRETK